MITALCKYVRAGNHAILYRIDREVPFILEPFQLLDSFTIKDVQTEIIQKIIVGLLLHEFRGKLLLQLIKLYYNLLL